MRLTQIGLQFALEVAWGVIGAVGMELAGGRRTDDDPDINAAKAAMSRLRQRLGNVPTQPPLSMSHETADALSVLRRMRQFVVAGKPTNEWPEPRMTIPAAVVKTLMMWDLTGAHPARSENDGGEPITNDLLRAIDDEIARLRAGGFP
jgi:hypothetical protein